MAIVNLGILAHVDAGKTSLTERLLYAGGVIPSIGSVDEGNTQTDSMALERQRGITIKTAVAALTIGDTSVNLIDTPGHPDFIAEVERVLRLLDGAVLVISAVEGVQAQTRVLLRTLRRLRVPTLLFVNKVDRGGARYTDLLREIADRLTPDVIAMGTVDQLGTRAARAVPFRAGDPGFAARVVELANDDSLLSAYLDDEARLRYPRLVSALAARTRAATAHPVFFGSAVTGTGVDALMDGIVALLPPTCGDPAGPVSGEVFKVERAVAGAKVAYVRMFSGTLHTRDRVGIADGEDAKVTAIDVVTGGTAVRSPAVAAGQIGKLWGLGAVRIGDAVGLPRPGGDEHHLFAPPTLETIVEPCDPAELGSLHAALAQLAEQDPLIDLRQDDIRRELSVSLYGEVQKEVIQSMLADEYGIDVTFRESTMIYTERPAGTGTAGETLRRDPNPFLATIELLVEPAPPGSGLDFHLDVPVEEVPIYLYRSVENFVAALDETVRETLRQGLYGWQVIDCRVTATRTGYHSPGTTLSDFRKLTPLVLMEALRAAAGTVVCEPIHRFHLDGPAETLGATLGALSKLGAIADEHDVRGAGYEIGGLIPAARVRDLELMLPRLSHGEGALESVFDHHRPVAGDFPTRDRWDDNPLDRKEYLLRVERRVPAR